jgi:hypothetical protein
LLRFDEACWDYLMARTFVHTNPDRITNSSGTALASALNGSDVSIACWFYPTGVTSTLGTLVTVQDSDRPAGNFIGLFWVAPNGIRAYGNSGFPQVTSGAIASTNTWSHACATYASTAFRLYGNGSFIGQNAVDGRLSGLSANTVINSGSESYATGNEYSGRIADVAVWTAVLSDGEAIALAKGVRPYAVRPASLLLYWSIDGLVSPEVDLSGHAYNGTLSGTSFANGPPATLWTRKRPHIGEIPVPPPTAYVQHHQPIQYVNRVVGF